MQSENVALLILDLQNDFCHKDGVYDKYGLAALQVPSILPNIINTINIAKQNHIPIIASQFTVLLNHKNEPLGIEHFNQTKAFLKNEGFRENTWGHDLLEGLPSVHYKIKKWNISPFYNTELMHLLNSLYIKTLILCGFTTNGVIETTAREAIERHFKVITFTDCVASYSEALHKASLSNLASIGQILKSHEWEI